MTRNRKPIASRTHKTVVKFGFLDRLQTHDECSPSQAQILRKVKQALVCSAFKIG